MGKDTFAIPQEGLRGQVTRGALMSGGAQFVRLAVQILSVVIMSRMLPPSEFGLAAMAAPVLALAILFQEFGITQAIIQRPELDHREASAMFWIGFGLSILLALALLASAPAVAAFYREPRVGQLTAAMAITVAVTGFGAQHVALLNRTMRLGVIAALEASGAVLGLAGMIVWALFDPSFWAIFAGSLVMAAVPAIGAWIRTGWIPGKPGNARSARDAVHFGAGVTGFNLANFFARNADNILIGRFWGGHALGLYDRAYKLLLMPIQQLNAPLSRVMLPTLSRLVEEPARYRHAFIRTLGQLLMIALPGIAFMTATADPLVRLLLGKQWAAAGPIFAALGFAGLVQVFNNCCGWLFISQARTWEFMRWGIFNALTCLIGFFIGLPYGPKGVAIVYALGELIRTPLLWYYVTRTGPIRFNDALRLGLPHLLGAFLAIGVEKGLATLLAGPPLFRLACLLPCSYAASMLVVAAFPQGREALRESRAIICSGLCWLRRRTA